MTETRKPAAFRIEPPPEPEAAVPPQIRQAPRRPRAMRPEAAVIVEAETDVFDEPEIATTPPPPATAPRRRSKVGAVFAAAFGVLVSLAVGLWADRLIRDLFARAEWLGWLAAAVAAIAAIALAAILLREAIALARLASVEKLRARAAEATALNDRKAAQAIVQEISAMMAAHPETAAGRRALDELKDDIIDGADLIRLAETELLAPLDAKASIMILDAAKRVSLLTAVSPRALVDIGYVLFEAGRLVRRLSELYGGRPGTLGFFRLSSRVLAHLAVTGTIAAGDAVVQQIVGHGLAARLSAKLGEGVVNGMMTARIGMAAMEATRPLPFSALKRPGMSDFLAALSSFAGRAEGTKSKPNA